MSFEEFAKRVQPQVSEAQALRAAELARKPFHDAFVSEVYPHWQGPLTTIHKKPGIESCTHGVMQGLLDCTNKPELVKILGRSEWLVSEIVSVSSVVGVRAVAVYLFAGDPNEGVMARVLGHVDRGLTLALDTVKQARGPLAKLVEDAVATVPEMAAELGAHLLGGLEARDARIAKEKADAESAEKARQEAEAKAKADQEARERERIERETAQVQARKDAEAKAKADAAAAAPETQKSGKK